MPALILTISGETHRIPFDSGPSIRDILDGSDFRVRSGCRGIGACGLCRVRLARDKAPEPTASEHLHLTPMQLAEGVRLACQIRPSEDLAVEILNSAPPSNWKSSPETALLHTLREQTDSGRCLPSGVKRPCGMAVDLGTTHLCVSLFDLTHGRWLADRWGRNPQQNFGADIVTRLAAANESPAAASEMSQLAVAAIGDALLDIATREGLDPRRIVNVTLVGNTAMLALLSGHNFSLLLQPEYWTQAVDCAPLDTSGWVATWEINAAATVDVLPPLAGFVGSDLLAGLVATRFTEGPSPALFIDFGTNSEIALWHDGTLWVTASAGGPAFESNAISCGVPAESGAVFRVTADAGRAMACQIIGDDRAKGLCGSGLVDLIACLLNTGQLSSAGKFADGEMSYTLNTGGTDLILTKSDVDVIQRAKAAIAVGIQALSSHAGVGPLDFRRVCVGGAFGRYLDIGNAQAIGLLPAVRMETVELAGNTALAGCCDVMLSSLAAEQLKHLRHCARLVNLAHYPAFDQEFFDNLYLQPLRWT